MPALDPVARLEAEVAEPAAADAGRRGRRPADVAAALVEEREEVVVGLRHADGLGAEDRAAARPRAEQRERAVVSAQDQRRARGRDAGVERFAQQRGTHAPHPSRGVARRVASMQGRRRASRQLQRCATAATTRRRAPRLEVAAPAAAEPSAAAEVAAAEPSAAEIAAAEIPPALSSP